MEQKPYWPVHPVESKPSSEGFFCSKANRESIADKERIKNNQKDRKAKSQKNEKKLESNLSHPEQTKENFLKPIRQTGPFLFPFHFFSVFLPACLILVFL